MTQFNEKITLIANEKCWMESDAIEQLKSVAALPGVVRAVGLPDLHPGKTPVGVVLETEGIIYPHLIGNDIGCGMGLFETSCRAKKFKQDRIYAKLSDIKALRDIPIDNPFSEESPISDLGTIGGGNHFAEFQAVEKIFDEKGFEALGLDKNQLLLLVHSGSRGYGQQVFSEFEEYGGYPVDSEKAAAYLAAHDNALLWARRNRLMVAKKLMDCLGYASDTKTLIDCHHNFLEKHGERYFHRKGAVSALAGMAVIPGSRGSLTYLIAPNEKSEETAKAAFSLSHGAGRKWMRSLCKGRLWNKYHKDAIHETRLGSKTVCHDTDLLYEEAPEAYKGIEYVIDALIQHNLCSVVATLRPLLTVKV
jgi:release factor H-coupled RctB family protein